MKELQAKRAEKLAELDQVKLQLESKEQELSMLYKEISRYDDGFHSGKIFVIKLNMRIEAGSFVGDRRDQSISHNDSSMMHEMSALDIMRDQANRTMVEKGAIGAAGGNLNTAAAADDDEANGGMLFETPPNDGQLNITPRPSRKTFSRSMSKKQ